jgi:electron transfer flavoprotein beta subunit
MRIVVAVKQAATLDEEPELTPDGRGVVLDDAELELNEWDDVALEAALLLTEEGGGEVIAVTVGGEDADEALLACLAKGAARALRIDDEALGGDGDALAVAHLLAAAVRREDPALVLCGVQTSDGGSGATGSAVAGLLGLPHAAVVRALEPHEGGLAVERELEGGLVERLALTLPALLTIQTGACEPRYATFRAIKQAREKPLEVLAPEDLGTSAAEALAAAGARVVALAPPERGEGAEMLGDDPDEAAERIAAILAERLGRAA